MTESTPVDEQLHDGPAPIVKDGVVYVGLKLAHPLSKEDAERCGALVKKDYNTGNTIRVGREWGYAMIEQARVQVDPVDGAAVRRALLLNDRNQPLTAEEIAAAFPAADVAGATGATGTPGTGDADASGPAPVERQQSAADAPAKSRRS